MILQRDATAPDKGNSDWFHGNKWSGEYAALPDKNKRSPIRSCVSLTASDNRLFWCSALQQTGLAPPAQWPRLSA